jgi:hypothetical protein
LDSIDGFTAKSATDLIILLNVSFQIERARQKMHVVILFGRECPVTFLALDFRTVVQNQMLVQVFRSYETRQTNGTHKRFFFLERRFEKIYLNADRSKHFRFQYFRARFFRHRNFFGRILVIFFE